MPNLNKPAPSKNFGGAGAAGGHGAITHATHGAGCGQGATGGQGACGGQAAVSSRAPGSAGAATLVGSVERCASVSTDACALHNATFSMTAEMRPAATACLTCFMQTPGSAAFSTNTAGYT
jgi:hypothetical protein